MENSGKSAAGRLLLLLSRSRAAASAAGGRASALVLRQNWRVAQKRRGGVQLHRATTLSLNAQHSRSATWTARTRASSLPPARVMMAAALAAGAWHIIALTGTPRADVAGHLPIVSSSLTKCVASSLMTCCLEAQAQSIALPRDLQTTACSATVSCIPTVLHPTRTHPCLEVRADRCKLLCCMLRAGATIGWLVGGRSR